MTSSIENNTDKGNEISECCDNVNINEPSLPSLIVGQDKSESNNPSLLDESESNSSLIESIPIWLGSKWVYLKTFMIVKILLSFLGPIKSSGLYYYDIYTDFYLMQTLFNNCHDQYGYISLVIIITSYITTVLFLIFKGHQNPIVALCFPIYHIANIFDQIKNNNIAIMNGDELPEETNASKIFAYQIVFLETTSESVLQLCLSCLVIRQFGLSFNSTERFIQVTGLFSSMICICISFGQRQVILTEKEIPGFATVAMVKSIMIWMVPLMIFLVTMYMIAFKENSLVLIIFSMGIMMHPIITIPISIAVNFIIHQIKKCTSKKDCVRSSWKYCFSMVSYFALICGCQVYLTLMWEKLNSQYLQDNKSTLTTAFAFYTFDQCHCVQSEAYSCTLSEGETPQFNIEDYLDVLGSLSTLPYFLIGMTSILVLWNFAEIYFGFAIPIFQFILGTTNIECILDIKNSEELELPQLQSISSYEETHYEDVNQICETTDASEINSESQQESHSHDEGVNQICETTDASEINLESQQESHGSPAKNKNEKWFHHQTLCLILSILYIIAIGLAPLIFSEANFWNDKKCKSGLYDTNSDVRILKCEACNCNTEGSNGISCNSNNGQCSCKANFMNTKCDACATGHFNFPICEACYCNIQGSNGTSCNNNGECKCKANIINDKCDVCAAGYFNFSTCKACNCMVEGSNGITCDDNGVCNCKSNIINTKCDTCAAGSFGFPMCDKPCNCNTEGSNGISCDGNGVCNCKVNIVNNRCDACASGYFNFPTCNGSSLSSKQMTNTTTASIKTQQFLIVGGGTNARWGNTDGNHQATEVIDLQSNSDVTTSFGQIPSKRWDAVGGLLGSTPILCGGEDYPNYYDSCFTMKDSQWTQTHKMTIKRSWSASVQLNATALWILGGLNGDSRLRSSEFVGLNSTIGKPGPTLPYTLDSHCAVKFSNNIIYVIGGQYGSIILDKVLIYNTTNYFSHQEGPSLITKRKCHFCGFMSNGQNSKIVVAGGANYENGLEYLSSVEIFDFTANKWIEGPELPYKLWASAMATSPDGGGVILFGGWTGVKRVNNIFELRYGSNEWIEFPQKLKQARDRHIVIPFSN